MIREEIRLLVSAGRFPNEGDVHVDDSDAVDEIESILSRIDYDLSWDEIKVVLSVFGDDSFFGVAWTLIHLIEKSPGWYPNYKRLESLGIENFGARTLVRRADRA